MAAAAVVCLVAGAASAAKAPAHARAAATHRADADTTAFQGLGAWLDVYDTPLRKAAAATVARFKAAGVATVFLETSKSDRTYDVQAPDLTGAFLDAAHGAGMRVVAWYLPSLENVALDARRSAAAVAFRSATGQAFDAFALDIESSAVRDPRARTKRLLALVARVRAAAPRPFTLGAIVPAPVGMLLNPTYWPGFPWLQLAAQVDAWVPMVYSTYRTLGADGVFGYTVANVALLRALAGEPVLPVHVVGGEASGLKPADAEGFVRAAAQQQVAGASLYDAATTSAVLWSRLGPVSLLGAGAG